MGSDDAKESYELEPDDDDDGEDEAAEPLEAEAREPEPAAPEPSAIKALDVCPNCGSPLGDVDVVVCMRCGFDLKSLKVIETAKGEVVVPAAPEEVPPLVKPGPGDPWMPVGLAAAGLGVLAFGYLSGAGGLVDTGGDSGGDTAGVGARFSGLLRMLVWTGVLTVSGLGGLYFQAHVLKTRLGDVKTAAIRMLGIVSAIGLITFFAADNPSLEWTVEAVTQALAFLALSVALFRFSVRDAATLMGITLVAVVSLLLVSALVLWAVKPGS